MKNFNSIVLITGGFDPIHSGHIQLIKDASVLGNKLVVGINSDDWLIRKKKFFFQNFDERKIIVQNIKGVDDIISWDDSDNSAIGAITLLLGKINNNENIIFANGGDRTRSNIPEIKFFKKNNNVKFKFGVGGSKKRNSSSSITNQFKKKILLTN